MSGYGLCSGVGSETFQPAPFEVAIVFSLSLVPLSGSAWFPPCNGVGLEKVSPSGFDCEMGLAAVSMSGAPEIGDITVCSRWCFLLCAL